MTSARRIAVLVTGSRRWTDRDAVERALGSIDTAEAHEIVLVHGDCGARDEDGIPLRGADLIADHVGRQLLWTVLPMPAQWDRHGKAAGPRRNACMVRVLESLRSCGYECHVLAFVLPDSRGTNDCIAKAEAAGFEVRRIDA